MSEIKQKVEELQRYFSDAILVGRFSVLEVEKMDSKTVVKIDIEGVIMTVFVYNGFCLVLGEVSPAISDRNGSPLSENYLNIFRPYVAQKEKEIAQTEIDRLQKIINS